MTSPKRARLEENEAPLDLSLSKSSDTDRTDPKDRLATVVDSEANKILAFTRLVPDCAIAENMLAIELRLTARIEAGVQFSPPVEYLYKPIEYALEVHQNYTRKYCARSKKLLFLGLNAGPWGMSQTGVPFGETETVANWLNLSGRIAKPQREHPARRITGFACRRSEVSGRRFWRLFANLCGTPDNFFRHAFLRNYCPVALMDAAGRNITPAELKGVEQQALQFLCDEALVAVLVLLGIEIIVSIGRYTEKRARSVVTAAGLTIDVVYLPHPSPRSPSNVNWVESTEKKLRELDLLRFFNGDIASTS